MSGKRVTRRFAPLDPSIRNGHNAPKLQGIIFDVDGTLCLPQNYMFREMRAALNIPKTVDILEHIQSLSNEPDSPSSTTDTSPPSSTNPPSAALLSNSVDPSTDPPPTSPQSRAVAAIKHLERTAMSSQRPQPGLVELMTYLDSRSVRKALCTRNFPAPVDHLRRTYLPGVEFWPVVTRETKDVRPKPSPEGLWLIGREWGLGRGVREGEAGEDVLEVARREIGGGVIMVGDSIDDMKAGRRAGAATVLLVNGENEHLVGDECTDVVVQRLDEIIELLEKGFESG